MRRISLFVIATMILIHPSFVSGKFSDDPYVEQWAYKDTGVYSAWDYATGSRDIVVAIIDNGFDSFHPDLDDNLWVNEDEISNNKIDDDGNGYVDDVYGWNFWDNTNDPRPSVEGLDESEKKEGVYNHGTIVAGIIGAKGNNGRDGAGINWDVRLMNLKVLGNEGSGTLEGLPKAIRYAVDNGADVINISMVGSENTDVVSTAIEYAYSRDVVVVAAAGNTMTDLNISQMYPICTDADAMGNLLLGVSAIQASHQLAMFSNIGSECIDITAPGVDIYSTVRFSPTNGLPDTYSTKGWNGTSFAAPFVSGAVALVKSVQPSWSATKIFEALMSTVHHTPNQDETTYANLFGSGLLQIDKALKYAVGDTSTSTQSQPQATKPEIASPTAPSSPSNVGISFVVVSPKTGNYEVDSYTSHNGLILQRKTFVGVSDITSGVDRFGKTVYATLKKDDLGVQWVYLYDDQFRLVHFWSSAKTGDFTIEFADLVGSEEPELILTPKFSSTDYFYTYSFNGLLLNTYHKGTSHDGCIVDRIDNTLQKDSIVLLCVEQGKTHIESMNSDFSVIHDLSIDSIEGGDLEVYDIDSDGSLEYIIAARKGRQQFVRIFSKDGTEKSSFRAYPSQYKGGFDFMLSDYDGDGKIDFILSPHQDAMPIRAVDFSGNYIESWFPFSSVENGQVFILPN